MSANTFREEELVHRRIKVGNESQTRTFPIIGGRLRLAHEGNEKLSIQTEIVRMEPDLVVAKATVETEKGRYTGTGTASAQRDARLADSLVELAETRAIARALRFGGVGVEYCSAEEVNHVVDDGAPDQAAIKQPEKIFPDNESDSKPKAKSGGNGNGNKASQAQIRALHALTKKADYTKEDIERMMVPFEVFTFQDLTREAASQLISSLQTEIAA